MTNLEYYGSNPTVYDSVRIYMMGNWLTDWHNSGEGDLIKWLLMEHKDVKYILSQFEWEILNIEYEKHCDILFGDDKQLTTLRNTGYFYTDIDDDTPIEEILESCEVR